MNSREQAEDLYDRILNEKIIINYLTYSLSELEKQNIDLYNRRINIIEKFIEENQKERSSIIEQILKKISFLYDELDISLNSEQSGTFSKIIGEIVSLKE